MTTWESCSTANMQEELLGLVADQLAPQTSVTTAYRHHTSLLWEQEPTSAQAHLQDHPAAKSPAGGADPYNGVIRSWLGP